MSSSQLILVEGIDGAGKSELAKNLRETLVTDGYTVTATREPGGSDRAEEIRSLLLRRLPEENFCAQTQLLLHYAARLQHLQDTVLPALERGEVVICDRFEMSSYVFQVHRAQLLLPLFLTLHQQVVAQLQSSKSACTYVLCDLPAEIAMERVVSAGRSAVDAYDSLPLEFHEENRTGYAAAREHLDPLFSHVTIDATQTPALMLQQAKVKLGL